MIDYKDISNIDIIPDKDSILMRASEISGLDKSLLMGLYESFNFQANGDIGKISEMFDKYFSSNTHNFDFELFQKEIIDIYEKYFENESDENRKKLNTQLLSSIHKNIDGTTDVITVLKIVGFMCFLKSTKKVSLNESAIKSLFESQDKINVSKYNSINIKDTNFSIKNQVNAEEDLTLYNSLRELLNDYSKSYGYNQHVDSIYVTILNFINQKSIEASTCLNVESANSKIYVDFINEIITGSQMNIMYQNIDYLKQITPDLQNLMFDLMIIVNATVIKCSKYNNYIDQTRINQYRINTKSMFENISSSINTSYLLGNSGSNQCCSNESSDILSMSLDRYNIYDSGIENMIRISMDSLMIIKAIQNEFVMKIRKFMNLYLSNAFELIIAYKHVDLKLRGKGQEIFYKN
jgi:hypothetical protein